MRPASRMFRAISFGVFCRSAPSTRAIMRSRNVSPGLAVIRTTIWSDSTRVPPVTAERSPPDSRITGADSPVMADSSTEAMPSMISPSTGSSRRRTPRRRRPLSAPTTAPLDGARRCRRLAMVSARVLRSVAAWALPRPSAIASAKLANSTVNQRNSATSPLNTFSAAVESPRSRTNRIVVSTLPTRTTNMTGLRAWIRGSSLRTLSISAPSTIVGSNRDRLTRGRSSRSGVPRRSALRGGQCAHASRAPRATAARRWGRAPARGRRSGRRR